MQEDIDVLSPDLSVSVSSYVFPCFACVADEEVHAEAAVESVDARQPGADVDVMMDYEA